MPALVEFRGVTYQVSGRDILRGIDLCVEKGETLVLLGRSGSGKTTLLKMVNRLLVPTGGEITFERKDVAACDQIRLRRSTGYVSEEGGLLPLVTVENNVGLVPKLEGWTPGRIA